MDKLPQSKLEHFMILAGPRGHPAWWPESSVLMGTVLNQELLMLATELAERRRVFDMIALLERQVAWSLQTFGPGYSAERIVDHLTKEIVEVAADPGSLEEWVDIARLALDGAWRAGFTPQQIADELVRKQTVNESRVWPDWRTADPTKAMEHDREFDEVKS